MDLSIQNFKCFGSSTVKHKKLTVYAGANGRGKSTATQGILLLRSVLESCGYNDEKDNHFHVTKTRAINKEIPLNGIFSLNLGNSSAVLNKFSGSNIISISFKKDNNEIKIDFSADQFKSQLFLTIKKCLITGDLKNIPISQLEFYYLNAERIGPRIIQELCHQKFPNTGISGEYTAQVLGLESGLYKISNNRWFPDTKNPQILFQCNKWLDFILPKTRVNIDSNSSTNTAQIVIENEFTSSDPVIATNIGFGISYVLPIIVTCLIAKQNSIVIIENPEAHLHPGGQSKIGHFLAIMASSGLNIIIETHSDHVINGIQIAIAKKELKNNEAIINFFGIDNETNLPEIESISISKNGELSSWPKGFFDQSQVDFAELIKIKSKNA